MKKYRGIIFDFNGVLWLDNHLQHQAWNEFSIKLRGKPLSQDEMAHYIHGTSNKLGLEYISSHVLTPDKVQLFTKQKESIYQQLCLGQGKNFKLAPGAIELLDFLNLHHISRNIATASPPGNIDFFFQHLKLAKWFDIDKLVYDNGNLPSKPAPDMYLLAAKNLNLAPSDCVVIEDAKSGIAAAKAADIGFIIAIKLTGLIGISLTINNLAQIPKEQLFL